MIAETCPNPTLIIMRIEKNILIVDDEEKARLYLAALLNELFPCTQLQFAASPAEAIIILEKQKVDLLLLDVEMPGMTGLELLSQLRAKIGAKPVIFISAYKRAEFIQRAMRLEAIDYIDKPVDPLELEAAVNKCFDARNTKQETINNQSGKIKLFTAKGEMHCEADDLLYFETLKRNSIAHFSNGTKEVLVRHNLTELEDILPASHFIRASRQYCVNKNFIKYISKSTNSIILSVGCEQIELRKIYPKVFEQF